MEAVLDGGSRTTHRVLWTMAARASRVQNGVISRAFYASFNRAKLLLKRSGHLTVSTHVYESLDELVADYPYRTHETTTRERRSVVLPLLREYARTVPPLYSEIGSERFVLSEQLDSVGKSTRKRRAWAMSQRQWIAIDRQLVGDLRRSEGATMEHLLQLLVKGREYFAPESGFSLDAPLRRLLRRRTQIAPSIRDGLKGLAARWLPTEEVERAVLKGPLYVIVDFVTARTTIVRREVKKWLVENHLPTISRVFGYRPPERGRNAFWQVERVRGPEIDGLDRLIQRDALKPVEVLGLSNGMWPPPPRAGRPA